MTKLALLPDEKTRDVLLEALGADPSQITGIADLVRDHVSAHGTCPRAATIRRVCRFVAPALRLDESSVAEVCDLLEREGDIVLGPGGSLFATPIRAVDLGGGRLRIASSFSTGRLATLVAGTWNVVGTSRTCLVEDGARAGAAIVAAGGVVLTPAGWACLDRVPCADQNWLDGLGRRLKAQPEAPLSLERDELLTWEACVPTANGIRWKAGEEDPSARLWRAKNRWGYWHYAWTTGGLPKEVPFVCLRPDEGIRSAFAVARAQHVSLTGSIIKQAQDAVLSVPHWLPVAEYRYLSISSNPREENAVTPEWRVSLGIFNEVIAILKERLGIVFNDATPREQPRSSPSERTSLRQRLGEHASAPIEIAGRWSVKVTNKAGLYGLRTLGELADWAELVDVGVEKNFGRKTKRDLIAKLEDIALHGLDCHVLGVDSAPTSAADFFDIYIKHIGDDDDQELFLRRFRMQQTLEEIGKSRRPQVTRERIRQILEVHTSRDRSSWGDTAKQILDPVFRLVEAGLGVAPLKSCLVVAGAQEPGQLELVSELAGLDPSIRIAGKVVTTLGRDELQSLRSGLRDSIEEQLGSEGSEESLIKALLEWGFRLEKIDLLSLATEFLGLEITQGGFLGSWRKTNAFYLKVLREAGSPRSAAEVAAEVNARDASLGATPRNVVAHFGRSRDVFSLGRGQWVHVVNAGIERDALALMAGACLELVPRTGVAINVRELLGRIVAPGGPDPRFISPYLVRDEMIHTGRVRGWRSGCEVAWRGGETSRATIAEWIDVVAQVLDQPFQITELVAQVAAAGSFAEQSVQVQAFDSPDIIQLGEGEWVSKTALFSGSEELVQLEKLLLLAIPSDDVISVRSLSETVPNGPIGGVDDGRLLWGIARRLNGIASRASGHLLWRKSYADAAWLALRQGRKFDLPVVFRTIDLARWLERAHGVNNAQLAYVLMQEAHERRWVLPCGLGWQLDLGASPENIESAVDKTPEFERLVRSSQDFVRKSPARDRLNASRRRRGLFEV